MPTTTTVIVAVDRSAAIRAGINGTASPVEVQLDVTSLTDEQRSLIADCYRQQGSECAQPHLLQPTEGAGYRSTLLLVVEPTQAGVLAALDPVLVARRQRAVEAAAQEQTRRDFAARYAQPLAAWFATAPDSELIKHRLCVEANYYADVPVVGSADPLNDDPNAKQLLHMAVDHTVGVQRLRAAIAARDAAQAAAREQKIAAQRADREQWIATHGSARLKRLVAEAIGHDKTYESERSTYESTLFESVLASERPGWRAVAGVDRDVRDLSLRSLALLDAARLVEPAAKLARYEGKIVAVAEFLGKTIVWPRD
jgi:hypothetical protein